MEKDDELTKRSWDVLLEYYNQTIQDCRTVGDQKYKMLVAIVVAVGGILYAFLRINNIDNINNFDPLEKVIASFIVLLSIALFISIYSLIFLLRHLPIINGIAIKIEELHRDMLFKKMDKSYLFCWDKIPGSDNNRFKNFLIKNFGFDWVKKENIKKIGDNINVFTKKKSLSLRLNSERTVAVLKIIDHEGHEGEEIYIDEFIAKTEDDKLNIYELELKHRFREIYPHLNAYKPSHRLEMRAILYTVLIILLILFIVSPPVSYRILFSIQEIVTRLETWFV